MLLYDSEVRSAEELLPHVAHLGADGRADQWLFDAVLLCATRPGPSTGASYHDGATNRADWEALQDGWFTADRGLAALQKAIELAEADLGRRPAPVQVILTIPYPSAQQADFGDVDGDGVGESLTDAEERVAVADWCMVRALEKWAQLAAPDLRLWGFYWTNEAIVANDAEIVQRVARLVHSREYRFLWIPWFRAPGFRLWREFGFDVAILQPNYAFLSDHLGTVRHDRLLETAALAEGLGMGVEMEVGYSPDHDLREREIFRDYLACGAPGVCGYQAAATAYFQSLQVFPNLLRAQDPDSRRAYDELAAYVRGEPVVQPGLPEGTALTLNDQPAALPAAVRRDTLLTLSFPAARAVGEVELLCARGEAMWSGLAASAVRVDGEWQAGGWTTVGVPARDADARCAATLTVPVFAEQAEAVRVRLQADAPSAVWVHQVRLTCGPPRMDWREPNLAYGCAYTVDPDFPRRYPDRGGMLTDGEASTQGWTQGRSVGWWGTDLTVRLDLGSVRPVDRVVVHCDGGGHAAVSFPDWLRVGLSEQESPVPTASSGLGPAPAAARGPAAAPVESVVWDGQRDPGDGTTAAWGHYDVECGGLAGRFVALQLRHSAWLMLSEIEVWSQGANVALGTPYACTPSPTSAEDARYADDGQLLVDGCVAGGLQPKRLAGWTGGKPVTLTVDLGGLREVREVVLHTLGGGLYGVLAPPRAEVLVSEGGRDFQPFGEAELHDPGGGVCVPVSLTCRSETAARAKFVRVTVRPSPSWTMLSEVVVR